MDDYEYLKKEKYFIENYIPDFSNSKIKWKIFDASSFYDFLENNYVDNNIFIGLKDLETGEDIPFGLTNTTFSLKHEAKYLVSYLKNKKGRYTILTCLSFYENFYTFEIKNNIMFISYVETNYFYQGLGLFKLTIEKFIEMTKLPAFILITYPSSDGIICHTYEYLKERLKKEKVEVFYNIYDLKEEVQKIKKLFYEMHPLG